MGVESTGCAVSSSCQPLALDGELRYQNLHSITRNSTKTITARGVYFLMSACLLSFFAFFEYALDS